MKNAMIWGANGGIGQALTAQLVDYGWTVLAVTHKPVRPNGATPYLFDADVGAPYEVQMAVSGAAQIVDQVHLWIYTVGDIVSTKTTEMTPEAWGRILDANLTGAFLTTHYSLPLLAEEAHLMYVGAISERLRLPGLSAYVAAKTGLEAFAEALGKEERRRRITVVRPGAVKTSFWEKVPLNPPPNALSPAAIASHMLAAYQQQHTGTLDIS